jgi:Ni/Co efflux regulator RcnB
MRRLKDKASVLFEKSLRKTGVTMNGIRKALAFSTLAAILSGGVAFAQDDHHDNRDNHQYVKHEEWKKGYHLKQEDWGRGEKVDYRQYHLRRPSKGYEWRLVDGNYVMAAVDTGVVATVVVASGPR